MSTQNRSGSPIISHGRGGAGNIAPDEKAYTDGEIVREGSIGDQGDGAYSSGRGGAGNIESPGLKPRNGKGMVGDMDVVPETAMREGRGGGYEQFHVGRGGEGNVHKEKGKEGGKEGGLMGKIEGLVHPNDK